MWNTKDIVQCSGCPDGQESQLFTDSKPVDNFGNNQIMVLDTDESYHYYLSEADNTRTNILLVCGTTDNRGQ